MFNTEKGTAYPVIDEKKLRDYANLKLAMNGCEYPKENVTGEMLEITEPLLEEFKEFNASVKPIAPIDARLQSFINSYLADVGEEIPQIPNDTFVLDKEGLARVLSFPYDKEEFFCDTMSSYKVKQGVLNNPAKDKRTTVGVFHITEGGLPIPQDKYEVPKVTFLRMLKHAFQPPENQMVIPYTSTLKNPTKAFVSLYLRPVVIPAVEGVKGFEHKKMTEMHFLVPGNMISCLDFVEAVFGNAGNPYLSQNDAALNPLEWTGHSGFAIIAPHLTSLTKKELGLPHVSQATERQKRDGMCWEKEDEKYNDGKAFKLYIRDASGCIVTIIADTYFGYCKKEVKTQISFSANLYGMCEEEHAGGAITRPSYDLGEMCSSRCHSVGVPPKSTD